MLGRSSYRILVSGIDTSIELEEFYDDLRAHVGVHASCAAEVNQPLHNALLVCLPPDAIAAESGTHHTRPRRNTGAALIDFRSRQDAETIMGHPFYVAGKSTEWTAVGVVPAESTSPLATHAEEAGRVAAGFFGEVPKCDASNVEADADQHPTEATVRLIQSCQEQAAVAPIGATIPFEEVEDALRHRGLLGHVHALHRLSATELHLCTDTFTAAQLLQDGVLAVAHRENPRNRSHDEWVIKAPRASLDTATLQSLMGADLSMEAQRHPEKHANFHLAKKHEVLEAMARLMSSTNGSCAAYRDRFGNVIFAQP